MPIQSSIHHDIPLIPQPTSATCWAASTAMMTRSSVSDVIMKTLGNLVGSSGGLINYSGQLDWLTGTQAFANAHKLRFGAPMSRSVEGLHAQLSNGPIMFDMLWRVAGYTSGNGSPGHMIVVTGISQQGSDVVLSINDPWPVGTGKQHVVNYGAG